MNYLKTVSIGDELLQIGSDFHAPPTLEPSQIAGDIIAEIDRKARFVAILGDIFHAHNGEDTSEQVSTVLNDISKATNVLIFTPGNHDLRGRDNPWDAYKKLPSNVICPIEALHPLATKIGKVRVLVANLFYDFRLIDPKLVGLSNEAIQSFHKQETTDGKYFMHGDTSLFSPMTKAVARSLSPDIDALFTHGVPHPSLSSFRTEHMDENALRLLEMGIAVICDPEEDERKSRSRWGGDPELYRRWWNLKTIVTGSNVFEHPEASFSDMYAFYGHNHKPMQRKICLKGQVISFDSHQPLD